MKIVRERVYRRLIGRTPWCVVPLKFTQTISDFKKCHSQLFVVNVSKVAKKFKIYHLCHSHSYKCRVFFL